jgi:SAM-dependent methyltransferase
MMSNAFEPESFDFVISRQFMPHFPNWRDVLARQLSLCRKSGAVIFHHHSGDNFELCEMIAPNASRRAAVRRGYPRNGHATRDELEAICRHHGAVLESLTPISFFLPTALLYRTGLDKSERLEYQRELENRMEKDEVYEFIRWFESSIIARLPPALSCSFIAVVRRVDPERRGVGGTRPIGILRRLFGRMV